MSGRGVLRIADLYARSERQPGSQCWVWTGGYASDRVSVRIWTFDHDRGEKRVMSGPRAVWNIAHGTGLGGRMAFMRCVNSACVNPAHVGSAADQAEIGLRIAENGKRKGKNHEVNRRNAEKATLARGWKLTPPAVILQIVRESGTNVAIAARLGVSHQLVSRVRLGQAHKHVLEAA